MIWGTLPLGFLSGGVLGSTIGLRPTLAVAGIGGFGAVLWAMGRPVRSVVDIASAPELEDARPRLGASGGSRTLTPEGTGT